MKEFIPSGSIESLIDDYKGTYYLVQLDLKNDSLYNIANNILPTADLFNGPASYHRAMTAEHLSAISVILLLAFGSGWMLEKYTEAALPFMDALTTWGAIITTYMVAKKVLENWIYWFVIDSISIYIFLSRDLYLTSFLFLQPSTNY